MDVAMKIKLAETYSGVSDAELSRRFGSSPQAFGQRLKTGKFNDSEMQKIAAALGATFVSYFEFPDGTKIGL